MTQPDATLIAAVVAATATILTLLFTVLNKRGEEFRTAQREVIASDLKAVGKAVHEVIALANIQFKVQDTPQHAERYKAAVEAAKRLKAMRLDVRYTLWGLDEAFRTLAKLPDWLGHAKPSHEVAAKLLVEGRAIGTQIDLAVRSAYLAGKSPGWWRIFRVGQATGRFKRTYNAFAATRKVAADPTSAGG